MTIALIIYVFSTALVTVAFIVKRQWLRILVSLLLFLTICYVLLFYTGSITRSILMPGPPAGTIDGFYFGIQRLRESLWQSYILVIYLALLNFILQTFCYFRRSKERDQK